MRNKVSKALKSWDDADDVLQEIGHLDRTLSKLEAHQNTLIDRIKAETKVNAETFVKEKAVLELMLEQFCESRLDEFRSVRTKRLTFGTVSFRLSTKLVAAKKGWEWVLQQIKELGWADCVRTKVEVDKEALKARGADQLALVGCKLKSEDIFGYEVDQAKIVESDAA